MRLLKKSISSALVGALLLASLASSVGYTQQSLLPRSVGLFDMQAVTPANLEYLRSLDSGQSAATARLLASNRITEAVAAGAPAIQEHYIMRNLPDEFYDAEHEIKPDQLARYESPIEQGIPVIPIRGLRKATGLSTLEDENVFGRPVLFVDAMESHQDGSVDQTKEVLRALNRPEEYTQEGQALRAHRLLLEIDEFVQHNDSFIKSVNQKRRELAQINRVPYYPLSEMDLQRVVSEITLYILHRAPHVASIHQEASIPGIALHLDYLAALSDAEVLFVLMHEISHYLMHSNNDFSATYESMDRFLRGAELLEHLHLWIIYFDFLFSPNRRTKLVTDFSKESIAEEHAADSIALDLLRQIRPDLSLEPDFISTLLSKADDIQSNSQSLKTRFFAAMGVQTHPPRSERGIRFEGPLAMDRWWKWFLWPFLFPGLQMHERGTGHSFWARIGGFKVEKVNTTTDPHVEIAPWKKYQYQGSLAERESVFRSAYRLAMGGIWSNGMWAVLGTMGAYLAFKMHSDLLYWLSVYVGSSNYLYGLMSLGGNSLDLEQARYFKWRADQLRAGRYGYTSLGSATGSLSRKKEEPGLIARWTKLPERVIKALNSRMPEPRSQTRFESPAGSARNERFPSKAEMLAAEARYVKTVEDLKNSTMRYAPLTNGARQFVRAHLELLRHQGELPYEFVNGDQGYLGNEWGEAGLLSSTSSPIPEQVNADFNAAVQAARKKVGTDSPAAFIDEVLASFEVGTIQLANQEATQKANDFIAKGHSPKKARDWFHVLQAEALLAAGAPARLLDIPRYSYLVEQSALKFGFQVARRTLNIREMLVNGLGLVLISIGLASWIVRRRRANKQIPSTKSFTPEQKIAADLQAAHLSDSITAFGRQWSWKSIADGITQDMSLAIALYPYLNTEWKRAVDGRLQPGVATEIISQIKAFEANLGESRSAQRAAQDKLATGA